MQANDSELSNSDLYTLALISASLQIKKGFKFTILLTCEPPHLATIEITIFQRSASYKPREAHFSCKKIES